MKQTCIGLLVAVGFLSAAFSRQTGPSGEPFAGRWDLTIKASGQTYPSWIEVSQDTRGNPQVRIVARTGSVHFASNPKFDGSHLTFTESYSNRTVNWDLTATAGHLSGTEKWNGKEAEVTGFRAPALNAGAPKAWSDPESLFDGKDLDGWQPTDSSKNHWVVENGELVNQAAGANLMTTRKFTDFKLHIEYNCPPDGNSGVYLRGRYEVQVEYEAADKNDKFHMMGSIYGFLPPAATVPPRSGQWESYDIMLVGRKVTVVRDDVKIIDDQEIPGITGGALDSDEGAPGPFYLQGDHTGGMKYRNIKVSVPQQ